MSTWLKILLGVALTIVVIFGGMISYLMVGQTAGKNLVIENLGFSQMADGTYEGQYVQGRWTNQVQLQVAAGKIVNIKVLKDVRFSKPEVTQALFDTVLEKQSLQVDAISGATITSKAYLKAMENALAGER